MANQSGKKANVLQHVLKLFAEAGLTYKKKTADRFSDKQYDELLYIPRLGLTLGIEWKNQINESIIKNLLSEQDNSPAKIKHLIITEYLSRGMLERCEKLKLNIFDENENGIINLPGFYHFHYAEPFAKGRKSSSGTPFSMKATRLIRAFLNEPTRKWTQNELVKATGITQGYASLKLRNLESEGYIRNANGSFHVENADKLLDDWSTYYRFDRHEKHKYAFNAKNYEEGLQQLAMKLKSRQITYAYTGWGGAFLRAPYGIPQQWMAYISNLPDDPESLGLYPVSSKENTTLLIPQDIGVFQFTKEVNGLSVVSDAQLYLDLLKMPGRAKEQAQNLRAKLINMEIKEHE